MVVWVYGRVEGRVRETRLGVTHVDESGLGDEGLLGRLGDSWGSERGHVHAVWRDVGGLHLLGDREEWR